MFRSIEDLYKEKEEKEKISQLPSIRKLKYLAMAAIAVTICLLLINLLWIATLSRTTLLVIRGFAGVFAIIFVVIVTIYMHKINTIYYKQRFTNNKDKYKLNGESEDC